MPDEGDGEKTRMCASSTKLKLGVTSGMSTHLLEKAQEHNMSYESVGTSKTTGKSLISFNSIGLSKKSKRYRKKSIATKTMQRSDDTQLDELHFPHVPICLGCLLRHFIAILMFLPTRELISLNIIKKIFHSFWQGGKGMPLCVSQEKEEVTARSTVEETRNDTGQGINYTNQTIADVLRTYDYGIPSNQLL